MRARFLQGGVAAALSDTPVALLHGPRQSGKTTLARAMARERGMRYISLDEATSLAAALSDPDGFVAGVGSGVVIDEAQRAPDLFRSIKLAVDRRRTPGQFLLTGSADVMLLPTASESLAGRLERLTLWPLSQGELRERRETFIDRAFAERFESGGVPAADAPDLIDAALTGGFPEAVRRTTDARRGAWFASYIDAMLQRDVRDMANIERLHELPRLLSLLASRSSGLLNYADLSRPIAIPQTTLKRYCTLLEAAFLVRMIPAWSGNLGLRLTKSPKAHIVDAGLMGRLLGLTPERLGEQPALLGPLLETFAVGEIAKQQGWNETPVRLFHFRASNLREVDVVLEDAAGRIVGIEVKAASSVGKADFAGLRALRDAVGDRFVRGIALHRGRTPTPFEGDRFIALPFEELWA